MIKEYKYSEFKEKAFMESSRNIAFPSVCMECGSLLARNGDFNYTDEWTASYTCTKCGSKFAFQPTDMGQSLLWLVKYDNKKEVFK